MQRSERTPHAWALTIEMPGSIHVSLMLIFASRLSTLSVIQGATAVATTINFWRLSGSSWSIKITRSTSRSNIANRIPSKPWPQQRSATVFERIDFRIRAKNSNDSRTSLIGSSLASAMARRNLSCSLSEAKYSLASSAWNFCRELSHSVR